MPRWLNSLGIVVLLKAPGGRVMAAFRENANGTAPGEGWSELWQKNDEAARGVSQPAGQME